MVFSMTDLHVLWSSLGSGVISGVGVGTTSFISALGYYGLTLGVGVCMHGYLSRLCYHV